MAADKSIFESDSLSRYRFVLYGTVGPVCPPSPRIFGKAVIEIKMVAVPQMELISLGNNLVFMYFSR